MSGRLEGKVAIVTGAGRGQGLAAAKLFAAEGAKVALFDIDGAAVERSAAEISSSADSIGVRCDVSSGADVQAGVSSVVDHFGRVDVLHNNAGSAFRKGGDWDPSQDGLVVDITEELFDKSIGVNLKSVFLMSKNVLPHMIKQGGGSIINVSSISGIFNGSTSNAYCAAKAGVVGLTKAMALSYGPQGVRVNAVCPGLVDTPLIVHITENKEHRAKFEQGAPLRRIGQPEDLARVALFLASDDSSFMTGSVVTADGGVTAV